jgi:hypothetical protein
MAQINKSTLRWIREVGLPEISDEQVEALAARLREAFAAEQQAQQIGADPSRNVGGTEGYEPTEDGAPIMLDNV